MVEAYWLTDFATRCVSSRTLYHLAKGRWTVENQGFNDAKSRYGLDHVPHHHANSLLIHWLLVALTLTIERLFRVRDGIPRPNYRPRGTMMRLFFPSTIIMTSEKGNHQPPAVISAKK